MRCYSMLFYSIIPPSHELTFYQIVGVCSDFEKHTKLIKASRYYQCSKSLPIEILCSSLQFRSALPHRLAISRRFTALLRNCEVLYGAAPQSRSMLPRRRADFCSYSPVLPFFSLLPYLYFLDSPALVNSTSFTHSSWQLKSLNESSGTHRHSFVEYLESAFRTPAKYVWMGSVTQAGECLSILSSGYCLLNESSDRNMAKCRHYIIPSPALAHSL